MPKADIRLKVALDISFLDALKLRLSGLYAYVEAIGRDTTRDRHLELSRSVWIEDPNPDEIVSLTPSKTGEGFVAKQGLEGKEYAAETRGEALYALADAMRELEGTKFEEVPSQVPGVIVKKKKAPVKEMDSRDNVPPVAEGSVPRKKYPKSRVTVPEPQRAQEVDLGETPVLGIPRVKPGPKKTLTIPAPPPAPRKGEQGYPPAETKVGEELKKLKKPDEKKKEV